MSTNAIIATRNPKTKKISAIYLHWDGYPNGAGKILNTHFTDKDKVDELIKLGNCSILAPKLHPKEGVPHSFDFNPLSRQEDVCLFYGRDRGEKEQEAVEKNDIHEIKDCFGSAEFLYLFENGVWTTEKL